MPANPGGGAAFFLPLAAPFCPVDSGFVGVADDRAPAQPPVPPLEEFFERKLAFIFLELGPRLGNSSFEGGADFLPPDFLDDVGFEAGMAPERESENG